MDSGQELPGRISGIITDALGVAVPSHDTDLVDGGLLDSLALVTLITEIESEFGFELPLDDFDVDAFRTVDAIAEFVARSGANETGRVA
jgi:D-alanine--poly(phosphoribitol) ligase subunit 2